MDHDPTIPGQTEEPFDLNYEVILWKPSHDPNLLDRKLTDFIRTYLVEAQQLQEAHVKFTLAEGSVTMENLATQPLSEAEEKIMVTLGHELYSWGVEFIDLFYLPIQKETP